MFSKLQEILTGKKVIFIARAMYGIPSYKSALLVWQIYAGLVLQPEA